MRLALAVAVATLLAACKSELPATDPQAATLLHPSWSSPRGAVPPGLFDRDVASGVRLDGPLTLKGRFAARTTLTAVKLRADGPVRLRAFGRSFEAQGDGTWERWTLPAPHPTEELELTLQGEAGVSVHELEVWGVGRKSAPRTPSALVEADPTAHENLRRAELTPSEARLDVGDGERCASFSFSVQNVEAVRRAFLVYQGTSLKRSVTLRRALNGWPAQGGMWLGPSRAVGSVLDELDPAQLSSENRLSLCLPEAATAAISLSGLKVIAELEDGTNLLDRDGQATAAEAWDLQPDTSRPLGGELTLGLTRPTELDSARLTLEGPGSIQRIDSMSGAERTALEPVGVHALEGGSIAFFGGARAADALRLHPRAAARADLAAARVAELKLVGSPVGPRVPRLVVTFPIEPEHFGTRAAVAGFVDGPPALVQGATLHVDGQQHPSAGSFFAELRRSPQDAGKSWTVALRATLANGQVLERTLVLDKDQRKVLTDDGEGAGLARGEDALFGRANQLASARVGRGGGVVRLGERVMLEVDPDALSDERTLSIQRRTAAYLPKLDAALINVTAPGGAGYKFHPSGQRFARPARVHLPYDAALVPAGVSVEEIHTWYYDEGQERWLQLPRVAVRRLNEVVVSESTHFTYMINGVLVLPEHPGPASFNPNSIKDLKAADPAANIEVIRPPAANNQGSAALQYPLRLAEARGAFQPQVQLSYDSGAGNGLVGTDWSLSSSSVDVDTRFGVPGYEGHERYLLDGAMLTPSGPATCSDGAAGVLYLKRVEGSFARIIRCGRSPREQDSFSREPPYYWEVTTKDGTRFAYGTSATSRLAGYEESARHIARWLLERVTDVSGNQTTHTYWTDNRARGCPQRRAACEDFRQLYPAAIAYTSHPGRGLPARHRVEFFVEREGGAAKERADAFSSGRTGFKVVTRYRLKGISVLFDPPAERGSEPPAHAVVRGYELSYVTGDFGKSVLSRIAVKGSAGGDFCEHSFEYEKPSADGVLFQPPVQWLARPQGLDEPPRDRWPLTETTQGFIGGSVYAGLGVPGMHVGLRFGTNVSRSTPESLLLDLNGDGLPDRVRIANWTNLARTEAKDFDFRFNQGSSVFHGFEEPAPAPWFAQALPPGDPFAGRKAKLAGPDLPPHLGVDTSLGFTAGLEAQAGPASFSLAGSLGWSDTSDMWMDADGDGLIDFVNPGGVRFQRERGPFCSTVAGCVTTNELHFKPGKVIAADIAANDPHLVETNAELNREFHPEDVLLQWTAPRDGRVQIAGTVQRRSQGGRDGVVVRAYRVWGKGPNDLGNIWLGLGPTPERQELVHLQQNDTLLHELSSAEFNVGRGNRIYFRVSTGQDFPVDASKAPPEPHDELSFNPIIRYVGMDLSETDAVGGKTWEFSHAEDFRAAGDPLAPFVFGGEQTVELTFTGKKERTADDVRVCMQVFSSEKEVKKRTCRETGSPPEGSPHPT